MAAKLPQTIKDYILSQHGKVKSDKIASEVFEIFGHRMSGAAVRDCFVRHGLTTKGRLNMPKNTAHPKTGIGTIQSNGWALKIRVATTGNKAKDYRWLHHVIWEKNHPGQKCPKGWRITFRDGDHENYDPSNIVCVPMAVNNRMNFRKWNTIEDAKLHAIAFDECVLEQLIKEG